MDAHEKLRKLQDIRSELNATRESVMVIHEHKSGDLYEDMDKMVTQLDAMIADTDILIAHVLEEIDQIERLQWLDRVR